MDDKEKLLVTGKLEPWMMLRNELSWPLAGSLNARSPSPTMAPLPQLRDSHPDAKLGRNCA